MKLVILVIVKLISHLCCALSLEWNGLPPERVKRTYGKRLVNHTFNISFGTTWEDCIKKCKRVRKCKSINYIRRGGMSGLCEMNDAAHNTTSEALLTRVGAIYSSKYDWDFAESVHCKSCLDWEMCVSDSYHRCQVYGCPQPNPAAGATILGNLFHVGTKRLYRCRDGRQQVSICQEDGKWSLVSINCTCEEFKIENGVVEITKADNGVSVAGITCNPGYFHRDVNKVECNIITMKWNSVERVGCISIYEDPWTKVYRTKKELKGNVISLWVSDTEPETGEFRNTEVISKWNSIGIKQVKVDVKNSGEVVTSMTFDGSETDFKSWFSTSKLISSSWTDLTNESEVGFFSISGVKIEPTGFLRWVVLNIGNIDNGDKMINCSTDIIWFTVTRDGNYPCSKIEDTSGRVIVYSKSQTGTTWESGELALAEEMVVSVWL